MEFVDNDFRGHPVHVGDFIDFIWWSYGPWGEVEDHYQGRIVKRNGHICFRYKLADGSFSTRRLSTLCYCSDDWEYLDDKKYKVNDIKPRYWSC